MAGFQKGVSGQIQIFPGSLKRFADKRVVGVNYDLLERPAGPKNQRASSTGAAKLSSKRQSRGTKTSAITGEPPYKEEGPRSRGIRFTAPDADNEKGSNPDVVEIKNRVRHAMNLLEEGKQAAAFNLLKRIVSAHR